MATELHLAFRLVSKLVLESLLRLELASKRQQVSVRERFFDDSYFEQFDFPQFDFSQFDSAPVGFERFDFASVAFQKAVWVPVDSLAVVLVFQKLPANERTLCESSL
jgi:hypothetical protein